MSGPKAETAIVKRALEKIYRWGSIKRVWRANSGGNKSGHRCNSINLPDIIGYSKQTGTIFACEVKTHEGKLSTEQDNFLREVCLSGGTACVYAPLEKNGTETFWFYPAIPHQFMPQKKR